MKDPACAHLGSRGMSSTWLARPAGGTPTSRNLDIMIMMMMMMNMMMIIMMMMMIIIIIIIMMMMMMMMLPAVPTGWRCSLRGFVRQVGNRCKYRCSNLSERQYRLPKALMSPGPLNPKP